MTDEYMEHISKTIGDENADILEWRDSIKKAHREIRKCKTRIIKYEGVRADALRKRAEGWKNCSHRGDQFNWMMCFVDSGLGYAGEYCVRCGTLIVKSEYRKGKLETHYRPERPFNRGCKHDWLDAKHFEKKHKAAVLCVYGRWCRICGRLENTRAIE